VKFSKCEVSGSSVAGRSLIYTSSLHQEGSARGVKMHVTERSRADRFIASFVIASILRSIM